MGGKPSGGHPSEKPKKITATRFAAILGLNKWTTPFEVWCEITKTYCKPFEDTIYTAAGKVIEPKQIAYMRRGYAMTDLRTPTDLYGEDYFNRLYGDFFHDTPILGGMWDSLLVDDDGTPNTVLEFKTTKRSEDWKNDVPEYYALQAALYAYLLGVDDVIMICSFLQPADYEHPERFEPNASNTITVEFKVSERYPDFHTMVDQAKLWWEVHVDTGISPDFDEKADAELLKILRTNTLSPDTDVDALIEEAESLKEEIDAVSATIAEKEKRLKAIKETITEYGKLQFREGDKKAELKGRKYTFTVSKTESTTTDKDALAKDGLLEKYQKKSVTYKLTIK